jgi:hypothetical protein
VKPTPRMLELRQRIHAVLQEHTDVLDDYLDRAREIDPGDDTTPLGHAALDSWVMMIRWADLQPQEGDEDASLLVELHSGCAPPMRLGLAHCLVEMES